MSITQTFTHKRDADLEQYSFRSSIRADQTHYIERTLGGPWELVLIEQQDSFTRSDARTFARELAELLEFVDGLDRSELHRRTKPGPPDLDGKGGGL